jgi:hypothetical protein
MAPLSLPTTSANPFDGFNMFETTPRHCVVQAQAIGSLSVSIGPSRTWGFYTTVQMLRRRLWFELNRLSVVTGIDA